MLVCPICKRAAGDGVNCCSLVHRINRIKMPKAKKRGMLKSFHAESCESCGKDVSVCMAEKTQRAKNSFRRKNKAAINNGQEGYVPNAWEIREYAETLKCKRVFVFDPTLPNWWSKK